MSSLMFLSLAGYNILFLYFQKFVYMRVHTITSKEDDHFGQSKKEMHELTQTFCNRFSNLDHEQLTKQL